MRTLSPVACLVCLLGWSASGHADVGACIAGAEDGQKLRDDGHLVEARAHLAACGQEDCPAAVRADCLRFIEDVERRTPSIVLEATWRGKDITSVVATLDGNRLVPALDAHPISLDPGEHHVHFEHAGDRPIDQTFVLRDGEKERAVRAEFEPPIAVPLSIPVRKPPVLGYAMTAASAVSAVAFIALGVVGYMTIQVCSDQGAGCDKPSHETQSLTEFIVGDASLAVAVVTAGIATWAFIRNRRPRAQVASVIPFRVEF